MSNQRAGGGYQGNTQRTRSQANHHGDLNTTNTSPRVKQYNIHWRDELRKQKSQWKKQAHISAAKKGTKLPNGYGTPTEKTFTLPSHRDPPSPLGVSQMGPPSVSPYPVSNGFASRQAVLKQSNQKVNTLKELIRDEAENIGLTPKLKDQTAVTINLIMNPDAMTPGVSHTLPIANGAANINASQLFGQQQVNGGPRITDLSDDESQVHRRRHRKSPTRIYHKPSKNFERRMDEVLAQDQVRAEDSVSQVSTISGRVTPEHLKRYSAKHQLTPIKIPRRGRKEAFTQKTQSLEREDSGDSIYTQYLIRNKSRKKDASMATDDSDIDSAVMLQGKHGAHKTKQRTKIVRESEVQTDFEVDGKELQDFPFRSHSVNMSIQTSKKDMEEIKERQDRVEITRRAHEELQKALESKEKLEKLLEMEREILRDAQLERERRSLERMSPPKPKLKPLPKREGVFHQINDMIRVKYLLLLLHFSPYNSEVESLIGFRLSVCLSVCMCVRGQISETVHGIIFIFRMVFTYVPGAMPVMFERKKIKMAAKMCHLRSEIPVLSPCM